MAPMTEPQLERRGRWAYELGRAAWASHVLVLILPLLLVARLIGRPPALVFTLGGVIVAAAFGLAMLHDRYARAVLAGLLAGLPAFALPVILRSLGILRLGAADLDPCLPASFVAGILAGAFVSAGPWAAPWSEARGCLDCWPGSPPGRLRQSSAAVCGGADGHSPGAGGYPSHHPFPGVSHEVPRHRLSRSVRRQRRAVLHRAARALQSLRPHRNPDRR